MACFSTNRMPSIVCLILLAVTTGTNGSTLHAESQNGRRRRRSKDDSTNEQKSAALLKAVMEEVIILRKQIRDTNDKFSKETQELKEELKALKGSKASSLPFEVDESRKTVMLKDWNLLIAANPTSKNGGNLIVGQSHDFRKAKNSFFSGYMHTGAGDGIVIVGGKYNHVTGDSKNAAMLGGEGNRIVDSWASIVTGGAGNVIQSAGHGAILAATGSIINGSSSSTIAGGIKNRVQSGHGQAIFAGTGNTVTKSQYSTVMGGTGSVIDDGTSNAILGGQGNRVFKSHTSVLSGGTGNLLNSSSSCHASGAWNIIKLSYASSIAGGRRNFIGGNSRGEDGMGGVAQFSSIAGGDSNRISEHFKFIGAKNSAPSHITPEQKISLVAQLENEHEIEDTKTLR